MKEILSTQAAPAAIGPYSQAVQGGNTVYVSGQLPIDPAVAAAIDAGQAENLPVNYLEGVAAQLDG